MKFLSETRALEHLRKIQDGARSDAASYEQRAQSCLTCRTPGACCLDEHFVNVHISRLEAVLIDRTLSGLANAGEIRGKIRTTVERYELSAEGDTFNKTYACPLYERGTGCLVHTQGKPIPCIMHACY